MASALGSPDRPVESAQALAPPVRAALRDLILVLADSKRLLGFRYGGWILGAPELETGIACASMAQDEWGHARLMYALLKDFGEDVEQLEHGRAPEDYRSMEVLDREPDGWAGVVALNALADTALSVQLEALRDCCYLPLRQRTEKLLAEEQYHQAHGAAWARRYARTSPESRQVLCDVFAHALPSLLRWLGHDGANAAGRTLAQAGAVAASGDELRSAFLGRIGTLLQELGMATTAAAPDFSDFDEARRRGPGGPDAETITRVRGDKNRDFLVEA